MATTRIPIVQDSHRIDYLLEIDIGGTPWSGADGGDGTGTASFFRDGSDHGPYRAYVFFSTDPSINPIAIDDLQLSWEVTSSGPATVTLGFLPMSFLQSNPNGTYSTSFSTGTTAENRLYYLEAALATTGSSASATVDDVYIDITYHLVVTPGTGGELGAEHVTVFGAGFVEGDTTVTFGGEAATAVEVIDVYHLRCVTPAHAVGLVDVAVTTPAGTVTETDAFEYLDYTSTPIVNAGAAQEAHGPAPSTITTDATVTPGTNNGTITYLWTQLDGPATAAIATPDAENTDITFATYVPGTYTFQLAATSEGGVFTARDTLTVVITPTAPPRVSSGGRQVVA